MKKALLILLAVALSLATLFLSLMGWYSLTEHSGWPWVMGYSIGAVLSLTLMERVLKVLLRAMR